MHFSHLQYVPCLRWKQGEYQALLRLDDATQQALTPLIEVPGIGWDFENQREARTIDEHLASFPKRVHRKWKSRASFVDLNHIHPSERMSNGYHPVRFVFDGLRAFGCSSVPVTGLDRDKQYQQEVKEVMAIDKVGACLRVGIEIAAKSSFKPQVDSLLSILKARPTNCDFILDLGAPSFLPIEGFARVLQTIIGALAHLGEWRTLSLIGTAFPYTMGEIKKEAQIVARYEWMLYKTLIAALDRSGLRLPAFGDYGIAHPSVPPADMRLVKPFAKIRYTINDAWYIVKAKNVRDEKYGGFEQYRELCGRIMSSRHYCGPTYSWGDARIAQCASGTGSTGNLTTWVQVDTNHHAEKVVRDISSFYGSSSTP
jgi:hypothetical protein